MRLITNMSRRARSKAVKIKGMKMKKNGGWGAASGKAGGAAGGGAAAGTDGAKDGMPASGGDGGGTAAGANGVPVKAAYKRDRPRSINDALIDAFLVLKHEKLNNPACWGASVFGLHDIYKKILPFVQAWRGGDLGSSSQRSPSPCQPLALYFATVDIRHCYDTIPHQVLCDRVLPLVLREPAYVCGRYARVSYRPTRPEDQQALPPGGGRSDLHVRYLHLAFPLKDLDQLVQRSREGESKLILQPWQKRCTILGENTRDLSIACMYIQLTDICVLFLQSTRSHRVLLIGRQSWQPFEST